MTPLEEQVESLARSWDADAEHMDPCVARSLLRHNARQVRTLLPLEVTDGEARITDEMVEAGAKGIYEVHTIEPTWEKATGWHKDTIRALSRGCLSAALTQPQTEIEGKPDGTWYDIPDGGGAATAAGAFDPDPLANPDCQECGNDDAGCLACGADANWDS